MIEPIEGADDLLPHRAGIVAAKFPDQLEIGLRLGAAGLDERPAVGQQVDAIRGSHQRH